MEDWIETTSIEEELSNINERLNEIRAFYYAAEPFQDTTGSYVFYASMETDSSTIVYELSKDGFPVKLLADLSFDAFQAYSDFLQRYNAWYTSNPTEPFSEQGD